MPAADGSSTLGGSTSVRGRVRGPHVAKLQAASVPIAGRTDRERERLNSSVVSAGRLRELGMSVSPRSRQSTIVSEHAQRDGHDAAVLQSSS